MRKIDEPAERAIVSGAARTPVRGDAACVRTGGGGAAEADAAGPGPAVRAAYVPPRLERLGDWSVLTLQQSVPIGPGNV